jgi:hypothetical protein
MRYDVDYTNMRTIINRTFTNFGCRGAKFDHFAYYFAPWCCILMRHKRLGGETSFSSPNVVRSIKPPNKKTEGLLPCLKLSFIRHHVRRSIMDHVKLFWHDVPLSQVRYAKCDDVFMKYNCIAIQIIYLEYREVLFNMMVSNDTTYIFVQ